MRHVTIDGESLRIVESRYCGEFSDVLAVSLVAADGPYATLSTSVVDMKPAVGCFWLKDWAENESIAKHLLFQGVIELTGRQVPTGFCSAKEARFK